MNWRDLQMLIPGWNLVYYLRDRNRAQLQVRANGEEDLRVMRCYAIQRDRALSRLDFETAAEYERQRADLVTTRIREIRRPLY